MAKYKVGITVGVFDLFHVGHLNLLERCKAMCDHLIVAVCGDDYVSQVKHKTPVSSEDQRRRILASLKCVDEVIPVSIQETENKMLLIKNHPFDVLFSGDDWKGSERYLRTEQQFAAYGAKIEYLPYTKGVSTSEIKGKINFAETVLAPEAAQALTGSPEEQFRKLTARYGGYWRYKGLKDYYYLVNPYFPTPGLLDEIKRNFNTLVDHYPSGMSVIANLAAEAFDVPCEKILVGNGAAELIQAYMTCTEGTAGFIYPTFEEYANRYPMEKRVVYWSNPENGFRYNAQDVISFFSMNHVDTLVLVNPDMPTGNFLSNGELDRIVSWTAQKGIKLLIDESFVDFADCPYTCIDTKYLEANPHVCVMKSISKSYGVPGFRLGVFASGDEAFILKMKKAVSIWNINSFGEFFLQIIGRYKKEYIEGCQKIRDERNRFASELAKIPYLRAYPSGANFILVEVLPPFTSLGLSEKLWKDGQILFRDCSRKKGFCGRSFARIAVRGREDNDYLIQLLQNLVK